MYTHKRVRPCVFVRMCACTVKHSSPALFNLCLIYNCLSTQTQTHETVWSLDISECMCVWVYVSCISIFVYTHKMYLLFRYARMGGYLRAR